jgi:hypothetical protein
MILRDAKIVILAVATVLALTACDTADAMFSRDIELNLQSDGQIQFTVCADMQVATVSAYIAKDDNSSGREFWTASGDAFVAKGTALTVGEQIPGLITTDAGQSVIHDGNVVSIVVNDNLNRRTSAVGFTITDRDLVTGKWLNAQGGLSAVACSD